MDTESLVQSIQSARFSVRRIGSNYGMQDVDDLLDRVVAAARAGQPIEPLVVGARFSMVRSGYLPKDVDRLLEQLGAASTGTNTWQADPQVSTAATLADDRAAAALADDDTEQRGLFRRLFHRGTTDL